MVGRGGQWVAGFLRGGWRQCVSVKIRFSGDFVHTRVPGRVAISGVPPGNEDAFRMAISGQNIVATITGLPAGKYEIVIGEVEASSDNFTNAGQRVFDVTSGDTVL